MNRSLLTSLAICSVVAFHQTARADALAPPGVYFGHGNPNIDFTVNTDNGIEIGLSAINRSLGAIAPVGNAYDVATGDAADGASTWGVDFSINLGTSGYNYSTVSTQLTVVDSRTGNSPSFPLTVFNADNACIGGTSCTDPATTGVQNSEPGSLLGVPTAGDPGFNDWMLDTYTVTLTVSTLGPDPILLASDTVVINAVPEPDGLAIFGIGLLGLGLLWHRRRSSTAD